MTTFGIIQSLTLLSNFEARSCLPSGSIHGELFQGRAQDGSQEGTITIASFQMSGERTTDYPSSAKNLTEPLSIYEPIPLKKNVFKSKCLL